MSIWHGHKPVVNMHRKIYKWNKFTEVCEDARYGIVRTVMYFSRVVGTFQFGLRLPHPDFPYSLDGTESEHFLCTVNTVKK